MKAILLGSSGFWKEIVLDDYPPTLHVPWMSGEVRFDSPGAHAIKMYDTINFNRIALGLPGSEFGVPGCVVYLQEPSG